MHITILALKSARRLFTHSAHKKMAISALALEHAQAEQYRTIL